MYSKPTIKDQIIGIGIIVMVIVVIGLPIGQANFDTWNPLKWGNVYNSRLVAEESTDKVARAEAKVLNLLIEKTLKKAEEFDGKLGLSLEDESNLVNTLLADNYETHHTVILNQPFDLEVVSRKNSKRTHLLASSEAVLRFSGKSCAVPKEKLSEYAEITINQ